MHNRQPPTAWNSLPARSDKVWFPSIHSLFLPSLSHQLHLKPQQGVQGTKLSLTSQLHLGCLMISLCSVPTVLTHNTNFFYVNEQWIIKKKKFSTRLLSSICCTKWSSALEPRQKLWGEGAPWNTKSVLSEFIEDDEKPSTRQKFWKQLWRRALL